MAEIEDLLFLYFIDRKDLIKLQGDEIITIMEVLHRLNNFLIITEDNNLYYVYLTLQDFKNKKHWSYGKTLERAVYYSGLRLRRLIAESDGIYPQKEKPDPLHPEQTSKTKISESAYNNN